MKKLIGIAFAAAMVITPLTVKAEEVDPIQRCQEVADLAHDIMEARQRNVPLGKLYNVMEGELSKRLIMEAYEKPYWAGLEKMVNNEIVNFSNKHHLACLKHFS